MEDYPVFSSKLTNNKTMVSWKIFRETAIFNFKKKGFNFTHVPQMNIIIVANKLEMTHDYYMKHNMQKVELI